jgi:sodium-coupled neutral amino acid transporter 11
VYLTRLLLVIAGVSTFTVGRPSFSPRASIISSPFKLSSTHTADIPVVSEIESGGDATLPTSVFNLAKSIIGAGVLSLPNGVAIFANDPKALIPASVICALFGLAAAYTFSSIGKVCKETNSKSFMEAWNKLVDPKSGWIISTSITAMCFLASLAYSIIIGDSFTSLAQTFNLPAIASSRTNVILLLSSLVLAPLCAMKSLSALAPFSLLGLGGTLYTAVFMLIRLLDRSYFPGGKFFNDIVAKPSFGSGFTINQLTFVLLSMLSTSYIAHYNAPKFYTELKNNTLNRFNTLVGSAFGTSILFFIFVMVTGFLQFGGNTSGFILNNYSSKDSLATLARFAIGLALLTGYPFTFSALREGLLDLQGKTGAARDSAFMPLTITLLGLVTGLALVLKDVGFVVSMTGALLGSLLMFIVPAIMNISSHKSLLKKGLQPTFGKSLEVSFNYGLIGTGVVMTVLGVYVSVMRQLGKL